jgi:hypothetical protein
LKQLKGNSKKLIEEAGELPEYVNSRDLSADFLRSVARGVPGVKADSRIMNDVFLFERGNLSFVIAIVREIHKAHMLNGMIWTIVMLTADKLGLSDEAKLMLKRAVDRHIYTHPTSEPELTARNTGESIRKQFRQTLNPDEEIPFVNSRNIN